MYYDAIAEGYDELHGEEQRKKLEIIRRYISPKPGERLLDVGCGTGLCTGWDCECIGIDPSSGLIKEAETNNKKARFIQAEAENLPFKDDYFDYVISVTAIHLCEDIDKALKEIKRVGKGKFVLSVLKKSSRAEEIAEKIKSMFDVEKAVEEDKDVIFLASIQDHQV